MRRTSFVLWCCTSFLVVAPLELQQNSTSNDMTERYEPLKLMEDQRVETKHVQDNLREKFTKDDKEMRHEFFTNVTKENREDDDVTEYGLNEDVTRNYEDDDQMLDINVNTTETKSNNCTTSHERHGDLNESSKNDTEFANSTYIPLCCPRGHRLIEETCVAGEEAVDDKTLDQMFHFIVNDPCEDGRFVLNETDNSADDGYYFFANGSLYYKEFINPMTYCLALVNRDKYEVTICKPYPMFLTAGVILSVLFLFATVVVYSILSELQTMHGYTLRAYSGALCITYIFLAVHQQYTLHQLGYTYCLIIAYFLTFLLTASFFWLNIMCFDIWWIFRQKTHTSRGNMKRQRKRKFLYALYGWGCPFIFMFICTMIEFVLDVPKNFIRPNFCIRDHWFDRSARIYFAWPFGIINVCNIFLFISTALTMARHKKDTDQLRSVENKCHNDDKKCHKKKANLNEFACRFVMYLKLFFLMGITWVMEIDAVNSWIFNLSEYLMYSIDMINALQGVIIFIIFVWKKKIRLSLMKKLGCQDSFLFKNSTSNDGHSTATSCSSLTVSLHSIVPCSQIDSRTKSSSNEADTNTT
ncbi:putative G-protein coupled receptor Mth-like protein [Ooceraea biroi]|uniref:Putative G-protein coupled receptor Mth-like protein n=1 Tax=Ooceraea biroi TaxID=2015173 RepID=A0A026WXB3_OOCBI|nr:putative G-protein coupled receptor Mth-like protein [Ooceraea biroi]